ncbi:uncharacterized protein LOC122401594 [Colletes gigas]|uniref:uncharacterized protein LOC122401594 n=1 Tax=Colletes gigas TaxID=935657 RepID=UPI001C9A486B|nr:uncharacterized protein LOC122401594 [Colletes gigas]
MPVEQTMEKQMRRIVLIVLAVLLASKNLASCTDVVSPLIYFHSEEDDPGSNDSEPKAVVDLNEVNNPESLNFIKSDDSKILKSDLVQDDPTKQPDITDNIEIVINGRSMKPNTNACKSGVCKISVSTDRDEDGNIVTDVHLKVISKTERPTINDIPVIDGVRGVEDRDLRLPDFRRESSFRPTTHSYNIPQIQTRYRDGEPWYQGQRNFQRPQITWHYHHPGEFASRGFSNYGGRSFGAPVVDDKIEPPLSKTRGN